VVGYVFLFLVAVPVGILVGRMARIYQMKFGSWSGCWVAFLLEFTPVVFWQSVYQWRRCLFVLEVRY
jgi:hypothetical protein